MLRSVKSLQKFSITATDGEIGQAETFYFDDERWTIRYLIVDTTSWRLGRQVLISPMSIRRLDPDTSTLSLSITREQIRHSPNTDTQRPVSRQHEREYHRYYHYPYYWGDVGVWGSGPTPAGLASEHREDLQRQVDQSAELDAESDRARLRSTREVIGYHIQATDGELGHVEDFLVDDDTWTIRFAVVDTSNWWSGNKVLIAVEWIDDVIWPDRKVSVDVSRQAVKGAPTYDPETQIDHHWETQYFTHYQRHGRWQTRGTASAGLVSLKQHDEFKVAPADADPRGWKVVSSTDGRTIGKVDDLIADPRTMKVRYLDIDLESDLPADVQPVRRGHILLPVAYARLGARGDCVTAEGLGTEDIARLPEYKTLPVPPQYDEAFRASVKGFRDPQAFASPESADYWSVARRDAPGGER